MTSTGCILDSNAFTERLRLSTGTLVINDVPSPQDDNLDVTTYVVHILEKNSVQIPDLSPGTVYLFRVQAQGSDGSPGGSVMEEVFETSREGT